MPSQLLVNVITVTVPAGSVSYPVPHGLRSNDQAVAPTLILPAAQSVVTLAGADAENVYLNNPSGAGVAVTLRCERGLSNEVDAETVTPFFQNTGNGLSTPAIRYRVSTGTVQTGTLVAGATADLLPVFTNLTFPDNKTAYLGRECQEFSITNDAATTATVFVGVKSSSGTLLAGQRFIIRPSTTFNLPNTTILFTRYSSGGSVFPNVRTYIFCYGGSAPVSYLVSEQEMNFSA